MANYTLSTIGKAISAGAAAAIAAAVSSAHGVDLSGLGLGEILTSLGTGLIAGGGVLVHPKKVDAGANVPAPTAVDQVINGLPVVVESVTKAQEDPQKVQKAAEDAFGSIPVVGTLAKQSLDQILKGRH